MPTGNGNGDCSVVPSAHGSFLEFSVDWAAHLGGLLAGILVGIPIFALHIESKIWRSLWVVLGTGATITCFIFGLKYMYSGAIDPAEELGDICGKSISVTRPSILTLLHLTNSLFPFHPNKAITKSSLRTMSAPALENRANV